MQLRGVRAVSPAPMTSPPWPVQFIVTFAACTPPRTSNQLSTPTHACGHNSKDVLGEGMER